MVEGIEIENKDDKLFNIALESNVHNFTVNMIKKWISEYSPTTDEYKLRTDLILQMDQLPMKMNDKKIDSFFFENVVNKKFLNNPLTILNFDDTSQAQYIKDIYYFTELTENMLKIEEEKTKTSSDYNEIVFSKALQRSDSDGVQYEITKVDIDKIMTEILERIRLSLTYNNQEDAYINYMILICLYLVIKRDSRVRFKNLNLF